MIYLLSIFSYRTSQMVMPQHTCIPKAAKIGAICPKSLLTDETTFNRPYPILLCFSTPNYVNYLFLTLSFMLLLLLKRKRIFSFLFSQCPPSVFFPAQKKKKKKALSPMESQRVISTQHSCSHGNHTILLCHSFLDEFCS